MPLHFLHIGKTGGTAIIHAIQSQPHDADIRVHGHEVTLMDIPTGEKVLFFLRHPVSRFVSGFYSRYRQGRPRTFRPWKPAEEEAFARFRTPDELGLALASSASEERAAAIRAMEGIGHVRSSFYDWFGDDDYLRSRLSDIVFIGFQETLGPDFAWLQGQGLLPAGGALPDDDIASHRTPPQFDQSLSGTARTAVQAWYARDIAFFRACADLRRQLWPSAPQPPSSGN